MKDGTAKRLPNDQADALIDAQKARRFISNTIYRAIKLGIEVKNFGTLDEKRSLKRQITAARDQKTAAHHKSEKKKKEKEKEKAKLLQVQKNED